MSSSGNSSFVYVTYIRTTPDKLWAALTTPDFIQQYWLGIIAEAEWKLGGSWKLSFPDGRVADTGQITVFEPGKRLGIRWHHQLMPELKAEGWSVCTMDIEPAAGDAVKLTMTHSIDVAGAKFIDAVSGGWPQILSNLKSLLETGAIILPPRDFRP